MISRLSLWLAGTQGIAPYQNAVLVDSSSRVLTLSENLRALLENGTGVDDGLVRHPALMLPSQICDAEHQHLCYLHLTDLIQ